MLKVWFGFIDDVWVVQLYRIDEKTQHIAASIECFRGKSFEQAAFFSNNLRRTIGEIPL